MAYIQPLGDLYTYPIKQGKEMKPFDLEAAKRGDPIVTRDGREAKFIAHVPEAYTLYKVVTLMSGRIFTHSESGSSYENGDDSLDLFMAPRKKTLWVNVYTDDAHAYCYQSEAAADKGARHNRANGKAYPVEIEE